MALLTVNSTCCTSTGSSSGGGDTITNLSINGCTITLAYTDANGAAQTKTIDISSCGGGSTGVFVTDLTNFTWNSTTGATVITFTKSDGTTDTVTTTILPTFVNTDDQQLTGDNTGTINFTLTPITQPDGSINYTIKGDLKVAATTPSGGTNGLKLDASGNYYVDIPNGSETKVTGCAGTTVTGSGTTADPYVICASGGTTPDGSETKLIAGKNTTVTGTGTAANPYVVNADLSALGSSILVNRTSNYAASGRSLTQYPFNNAPAARQLGTPGIMTLSGGGVLLQPGYRYRVTTRLQVYTAAGANSWTSYVLKLGGTSIDASLYMKHNGFEFADNANGQQYSMYDVVEIPAGGSAQLLTLVNLDGTTASTWTFESLSSMLVEVVGVL